MIVSQAQRDGIAAASGSLTECAAADNTFRTWAAMLRCERGVPVYRAAVSAYVEGKRQGAAAFVAAGGIS